MTMLFWLFAVYGWMLAIIFGVAYVLCYRSLKRSWAREDYYMQMMTDHFPELKPSLAAFKAARIVAPVLLMLCLPALTSAQDASVGEGPTDILDTCACGERFHVYPPRSTAHLWVLVAGNAADLISTEYVIHTGRGRERNPFMGATTAQRVIVKSAGTAAQVWIIHTRIGRHHPRLAKVLGYGIGAAMTGVAVRNLQVRR